MMKKVKSESWERGWESLLNKKVRELVDGIRVFDERREEIVEGLLGFEEKSETKIRRKDEKN